MYSLDLASLQNLRGSRVAGIGANVACLGLTSMLTDVSSEMVASILPIWFVFVMGLTPLQFGVVDGLSQAAAVVARLLGGPIADRWRRHRDVAALGYGLSAISRPLLLAAGGAWGAVLAVIAIDRIGKGIRTSPRDSLISRSCEPAQLGRAFGIHRAFDTAGALLGPLVASAMLAALPQAFDLVFVTSFFVAIMGLAVLLCFVKEVQAPAGIAGARRGPGPTASLALLRDARLRSIAGVAAALGVFTIGDAFVFLVLQRKLSTQPAWFPLFYAVTSGAYLLLAIPAGSLGDRFGRARLFLAGHGFLLLAGIDLLASGSSLFAGLLALGLLGAYYACTDGVLMAMASRHVPAGLRASGLGIVATANGAARLLASLMFGALWNGYGAACALIVFTVGLACTLLVSIPVLSRLQDRK